MRPIAILVTCAALGVAPTVRADPPGEAGASGSEDSSPATIEVQVQGEKVRPPVPGKDATVAGSVVRGESLRAAGTRATDVLRSQPGVQVIETGGYGSTATASVRGATAADTPVYLGGVRLNDDVGGTADLSLVPLWLIERVEIYRGNAPLEADRLGPGGAIFFEPRRPTGNGATVGAMAGSFGARGGWTYLGLRNGPVSSLVGLSADAVDNDYSYVNDHGTLLQRTSDTVDRRSNADVHTLDGWGLARIDLGGGARIDVLANGIVREQGVPSLALLPTREARSTTHRAIASAIATVPFGPDGRHAIEAKTSVIFSRATYHDPLQELALQTSELTVSAQRVEQTLAANLEVSSRVSVRPALSLSNERIYRTPDDIPVGRSHRFFARAAATARVRLSDRLSVHGLLSGECHAIHSEDPGACDILAPSGRAGAELAFTHLRLLANVARYVRVPTLGEVYGVSGVVRGNPNLDPETGVTVELGLRATSGRTNLIRGAYVDAFVFARTADKLIAYARAGQGYVIPYNVGRARVFGAEVLVGASILPFLSAEVATTLLDPRDTSPDRTTVNDILPFRSRLVFAPRIVAALDFESRVIRGISSTVSYVYQSSRYVDPAGLGRVDEQGSLDVSAEANWLGGHLTTRVRIADILDALRTDAIGYPLPGRSAFLAAEVSW